MDDHDAYVIPASAPLRAAVGWRSVTAYVMARKG